MPLMIHTIARSALPENMVVSFEVAGTCYLVADVEGEVQAYALLGPSAARADRATVAEGRLRCSLHGWPIDPTEGRCGAAERCSYQGVPVEVDDDEIRVSLLGP